MRPPFGALSCPLMPVRKNYLARHDGAIWTLDRTEQCCGVCLSILHEQRIDAMHTAQLAPPPATNVSAANISRRPIWAALTSPTPGIGRAPGPETGLALAETAETPIDAQHRRPAPGERQATAEMWVGRWVEITSSGKDSVSIALFCNKWRMGWDSNPRCACTHAGFQDRCLKPLGHPSGMRLLLRPRRRVHIRPPP
jgi:hypothetical protein